MAFQKKNVYRFCSTFLSDFCGQGTNSFSDHVIYKIYFSNWAKLLVTIRIQGRIASKNEDEKGMVKSSSNISSIFVELTPS